MARILEFLEQPDSHAGALQSIERSLPRDPIVLMALGAVADALVKENGPEEE